LPLDLGAAIFHFSVIKLFRNQLFRNQLANRALKAYSQSRPCLRLKKGEHLTHEELKASYVVIRHNVRTYESAGVVEVVKGRTNAEATLKNFEAEQSSSDRHEGWRYFLEKSTLKAGTDPAEATELRQAELERRETKATQDAQGSNGGGGFSR
jgi:hypothetical protein